MQDFAFHPFLTHPILQRGPCPGIQKSISDLVRSNQRPRCCDTVFCNNVPLYPSNILHCILIYFCILPIYSTVSLYTSVSLLFHCILYLYIYLCIPPINSTKSLYTSVSLLYIPLYFVFIYLCIPPIHSTVFCILYTSVSLLCIPLYSVSYIPLYPSYIFHCILKIGVQYLNKKNLRLTLHLYPFYLKVKHIFIIFLWTNGQKWTLRDETGTDLN